MTVNIDTEQITSDYNKIAYSSYSSLLIFLEASSKAR